MSYASELECQICFAIRSIVANPVLSNLDRGLVMVFLSGAAVTPRDGNMATIPTGGFLCLRHAIIADDAIAAIVTSGVS